jgi:hypothetical protein
VSKSRVAKWEIAMMSPWWLASHIALWQIILVPSFLLLGALRALALLSRRLDQLEATAPSRVGRNGREPDQAAPDFRLQGTGADECSFEWCVAGW